MRICDRCHTHDGSAKAAVDTFERGTTGEVTDLCQSCADETTEFLNKVPDGKKRTRKKSKKAKKDKT